MIKLCLSLMFMVLLVNSVSFDDAQAQEMAGLSYAAYCDYPNIQQWQNLGQVSRMYPGYTNIQIFEYIDDGNMGYIAYNTQRNQIVVVFRGSDNIDNWVQDFSFYKSNFIYQCSYNVHSGVLDAYLNLKPHLYVLLNGYIKKYSRASLIIVGHSLGGQQLPWLLQNQHIMVDNLDQQLMDHQELEINTFIIGSRDQQIFYILLELQIIKILYHMQVILILQQQHKKQLPFQFFGFYHVDQEIWYQNGQRKICRLIKGEDPSCSYSVQSFSVDDHKTYLNMKIDC